MKFKPIWYMAVEQFGPERGEVWVDYLAWSGLNHLEEVVSLDVMLCPSVIETLIEEDWQYNTHEDFRTHCFKDLPYLLKRTAAVTPKNILAICLEPDADAQDWPVDGRFKFLGYDLIEEGSGVSALTNCGGFPAAFENNTLNQVGLLTTFVQAQTVQKSLRVHYPDEIHAFCDIWAIWRMRANN